MDFSASSRGGKLLADFARAALSSFLRMRVGSFSIVISEQSLLGCVSITFGLVLCGCTLET